MKSTIALALGLAAKSAYAGFATTLWSTNEPTNLTSATIQQFSTVLEVPPVPSQQGLFLWPGMYAQEDWLVQTILTNDPQYIYGTCGQPEGTNVWCVQSFQFSGQVSEQGSGNSSPVSPGDMLNIVYQYNSNGTVTQTTTRQSDNAQLTTLTFHGGAGWSLSNMIECHQAVSSTPEHTYYNTTMILAEPNCDFNNHLDASNASPSSFSSTNDDCTTWVIPEITLGASSCACNPTGDC